MGIQAITEAGNTYTYLTHTSEIVFGDIKDSVEPISFDKRKTFLSFPNVDKFVIGVTTKCNMRCVYCCYSGNYRNSRSHGNKSMDKQMIGLELDFIETMFSGDSVTLCFYGGECLLEFPILQTFVSKARERWNEKVKFELSTNGLLLSEERINWIVDNDIKINLSLDGPQTFHDRQRITTDGKPSFSGIYSALVYLSNHHREFFLDRLTILMTLTDAEDIIRIAEQWDEDKLLKQLNSLHISCVAPNYAKGVMKRNVQNEEKLFYRILKAYQSHRKSVVLKTFFNLWLIEWEKRNIYELSSAAIPTCVPANHKLYIDTNGEVSICEKLPDTIRIGNIRDGIDWEAANEVAESLYSRISMRCSTCPILRLCDFCPTILDLSDDEMDIYCHNRKVEQQLKMLMLCEMAERNMIE